jgi:hypothetical protein
MQVTEMDPYDATIFANHSLCWLRLKNGDKALEEARKCKMMRPRWSKAWYREGAALSFMKVHMLLLIRPLQSNSFALLVCASLSWY